MSNNNRSRPTWDEDLSLGTTDWQRFLQPSSPLEAEAALAKKSSSTNSLSDPKNVSMINETHSLAARISAIAHASDSVSSMAKQLSSGQPYHEDKPSIATTRSDKSFDAEINTELDTIRKATG